LRSKIFKAVQFLLFLSLGGVLLFFAFKDTDFNQMIADLKSANYFWLIPSFVFAVFSHIARAYRWNLLLEPMGYKPLLRNTFFAVMTGYLANYAFPRIGEVTRCATLGKKEKIPVDKLIGTVILERAVDLVFLMFLVILLFVLKFDFFGKFLNDEVLAPIGDKIASVFGLLSWFIWIAISIVLASSLILLYYIREKFSHLKVYVKFRDLAKNVTSGLTTVFKMNRFYEFMISTVVIWGSYLMMTWVIVFTLPYTKDLTILDGLFLLVIGGLGIAAPVQSGIGAYHWLVALALTIYGIDRAHGLAWATISHTSMTLMIFLVGGLSFLALAVIKGRGSHFKEHNYEQITDHTG